LFTTKRTDAGTEGTMLQRRSKKSVARLTLGHRGRKPYIECTRPNRQSWITARSGIAANLLPSVPHTERPPVRKIQTAIPEALIARMVFGCTELPAACRTAFRLFRSLQKLRRGAPSLYFLPFGSRGLRGRLINIFSFEPGFDSVPLITSSSVNRAMRISPSVDRLRSYEM
jgi:hypothetical protein